MQYFRIAKRAIQEGRLSWLASTAAKTLVVPLSHLVGRPLGGPLMANLVLTYRCNNECFMCDIPKEWFYSRRGSVEFSTEEWKSQIEAISRIGAVGLSFAGGEPTLRPDCFELMAHATKLGLFVHVNTNAYSLHRPERVDAFLAARAESMNISLDGATPETHNRLRGAPQGFERVERATRLVLERRSGAKPALTYTFVIGPENFHEIPAFIELARRRGVTSVSFNPLTGCYKHAKRADEERLAGMDRMVDFVRETKAKSPDPEFIDNSDDFLSLFPRAFRGEPSPLKCYVGYHDVVVDCYGNLFPCTIDFQFGRIAANVRATPLDEIWAGARYQKKREALIGCTECYWNCHTELNLLYQKPPRTSGPARG